MSSGNDINDFGTIDMGELQQELNRHKDYNKFVARKFRENHQRRERAAQRLARREEADRRRRNTSSFVTVLADLQLGSGLLATDLSKQSEVHDWMKEGF